MSVLQVSLGLLFLGQLLLSSPSLAAPIIQELTIPVNMTAKPGQRIVVQVNVNISLVNTNENLALNKPTTQSSIFISAEGNSSISSKAVDGVTTLTIAGHDYCAITNQVANSWWAVDLGQESTIGRVRITSRQDGYPEQLTDFYIGLTNVSPWTTAPSAAPTGNALCKHNTVHPANGIPTAIFCEPNTAPGRYLYVYSTTANYLSICELEAYYN